MIFMGETSVLRLSNDFSQRGHAFVKLGNGAVGEVEAQGVFVTTVGEEVGAGDIGHMAFNALGHQLDGIQSIRKLYPDKQASPAADG